MTHGVRRGARRSSFLIAVLVVASGVLAAMTLLPAPARGATLYVGGGGPGNYTTIQAAVDAANAGDTVFVYAGTYVEHVTVPKPLALVGEDRATTFLDGNRAAGDVLTATGDGLVITGFTVRNGYDSGIVVNAAPNCRIAGNNVSDNWQHGIYLGGSSGCVVEGNAMWENIGADEAGVYLQSSDGNRIVNNTAMEGKDGVSLHDSSGNVVAGNNLSWNWDYGVSLYASDGNRVENNSMYDNDGYGVRVYGANRNVIRNNTFVRDWKGVDMSASQGNLVADNTMESTWDYAVDLYMTSGNRVTGNTIVSTNAHGIIVGYASSETIDNNTFRENVYADIFLVGSRGIRLADNTMTRGILMNDWGPPGTDLRWWNTHEIPTSNVVNGRPVYYWKNVTGGVAPADAGQVLLANAAGVRVENLTFDGVVVGVEAGYSSGIMIADVAGQGDYYGALLVASRDAVVERVRFANASQYGVRLLFTNASTVRNGTFDGAGYAGVALDTSFGNTIEDVVASGGAALGLSLWDSGDNVVARGTFSGHASAGASLYGSHGNTFVRSTFADNAGSGVSLWDSDRNTILENTVSGNGGAGVNVTGGVGNRAFHNNFVGNARNAWDDRANLWNDSYPSGGNYWDDYAGVDLYSGPLQDQPGADGIGDTPYGIDGNSSDAYPLMQPFPLADQPPAPPRITSAVLAGAGLADVRITWDLSADDGGGETDVAGYEVWAGATYDASGATYARLAALPAGTTAYVHAGAGVGDLAPHFYEVRAIEAGTGRSSASPVQGAKAAVTAPPGTHLFTVPFALADPSVASVFASAAVDSVRTYRASDPADPWKVWRAGRPGTLDAIELGDGLWVHVTAASTLTVAGLVVAAPSFELRPGWNLVGYATPVAETLAQSLAGVPGVVRVETYDPLSGDPYALRVVDPAETLMSGAAYWIYVEGPGGVWTQG